MKKRQFVDHIRIYVRAGDGGNCIVHFRREKYVPKGGPDGGDGGDGGDVVLKVASDTDNLTHLFFKSRLIAKSGDHGQGREKHGKSGKNLVVRVEDQIDHRIKRVILTNAGKQLFFDVLPIMEKTREEVRKDISDQDIETFKKVLSSIIVNLEDEKEKPT